jgi:hypothetical protein
LTNIGASDPYHLPPEATAQLKAHSDLINEKYHARPDEQEVADA